jgi:hypothetical protein
VYPVFYNFSTTSTALVFLTTAPAVGIAFTIHVIYLQRQVLPQLRAGTFGELENYLRVGVLASPLMPIGLVIFGSHPITPSSPSCILF